MKSVGPRPIALVVDPDPVTHRVFADLVESLGFEAIGAREASEAINKFRSGAPSLVLLDLNLPDMPGRHLLRQLCDHGTGIPVIVLATAPDVRTAVEVTRGGAAEFLDKATGREQLRETIEAILQRSPRNHLPSRPSDLWERDRVQFWGEYDQVFRRSEKMRVIEKLVVQVADTNATVLIQGETGVGKERVAKAIHYLSDRAAKPWLKVNCASLPRDLLESELFGHEKGAFTGAALRKPGRFELANGGTLLLDEIGEMPIDLQSKILHVLQDNEFFRVGGRELISVDVRIIAATNKNIQTMVASGSFREDLYYRLNVVTIFVPPLRERREEIPFLVEDFREKFSRQFSRRTGELSMDTLQLLRAYSWPGNVRELENLIKRYVVLGDEGQLRDELQVRLRVTSHQPSTSPPAMEGNGVETGLRIDAGLREIGRRAAREAERSAIREVLDRVQWNRAETARLLKISYKTLLYKLEQGGFGNKRKRKK